MANTVRTDLILAASTKGFQQAAQETERLTTGAAKANEAQAKGYQAAQADAERVGEAVGRALESQGTGVATAQKSVEEYQAELARLEGHLKKLQGIQQTTVREMLQTEKGTKKWKELKSTLKDTGDYIKLTENAIQSMNAQVLGDKGAVKAADKLVESYRKAKISQRQYRRESEALKRELQSLAKEQAAVSRAMADTAKGTQQYKALGDRMRDVGERTRTTEGRLRALERATGKGMPVTERDLAKGAFVQGLVQGALPGVGPIQRGPGMQAQIAGTAVGRGARGVVQGAFGGVRGLQQMLAAAPVPGAGVLAAQFGQAISFAGGGMQQQQARLRGVPLLGGVREVTGRVTAARMAARRAALARSPEMRPADMERDIEARREQVRAEGLARMQERIARREAESRIEREVPGLGARKMTRGEYEAEMEFQAMRAHYDKQIEQRREARVQATEQKMRARWEGAAPEGQAPARMEAAIPEALKAPEVPTTAEIKARTEAAVPAPTAVKAIAPREPGQPPVAPEAPQQPAQAAMVPTTSEGRRRLTETQERALNFVAEGQTRAREERERERVYGRLRDVAESSVRKRMEGGERKRVEEEAKRAAAERRDILMDPVRRRRAAEQRAARQARRQMFAPIRRAGAELGAMAEPQAIQFVQQVAGRGGGGVQDLQRQGMLRAAMAAQTTYGIGADISGAFQMAGRRGGLVGAQGRAGEAMVDALKDAVSLGLEGSEVNEYMQTVAAGIEGFKQTGMPINSQSIATMGKEFSAAGVGGVRGQVMGRQMAAGVQRISQQGIQSGVDLLAAQVFGGFKGGGMGDWWEATKRMEKLGGAEGGITPEMMKEFVTRGTAGLEGPAGFATLRRALGEMGVTAGAAETEALAKSVTAPETMTEEQRAAALKVQTQMQRGLAEAPRGVKDLEADARRMIEAFGPEIKRAADLQNQQNDIGEKLLPTFTDLQKSTANISTAFSNLSAEPLKKFAESAEGLTKSLMNLQKEFSKAERGEGLGVLMKVLTLL